MSKLLFLSHRIPFPPDKGDKIRSFHVLKHLAQRHQVYLAAFVDDPDDWRHETAVGNYCAQVKLLPMSPARRRLFSLSGLLTGEPLSVPYYRSRELQRWIDRTVRAEGIADAFVFSSTMAQYLSGVRFAGMRRIADFCDVDSDKWRQYAQGKRWPIREIYSREARKLLEYERRIAGEFAATLFVSEAEVELFRTLAPETTGRVGYFDNGVDTEFFDPAGRYPTPYGASTGPIIVFTGAMDYWANVDGVVWFAQAILPRIRAEDTKAEFWIVGSNPDPKVIALSQIPGVNVTGKVDDIRPYLAHASLAVAPLRIARGIQNKILEALAMARPVVSTPAAATGLQLPESPVFRIASEPEAFARAVLDLRNHGSNPLGRAGVMARYGWVANLATVDRLFGKTPGSIPGWIRA